MRHPVRRLTILAAAATLAAACPAQTVPSRPAPTPSAPAADPAPSSTVVVTGRRLPPAKTAQRLAHAITPTVDVSEALARFPDSVCPSSEGMPLDYDARIVARIRADAVAAGIRVDAPGCRPNVMVMVAPSGQAVVRELRRTHGYMFGQMERAQVDAMVADAGPVHGWTVTQRRSRDGDTLRQGTMREDVSEIQVRDASVILAATRMDMDAAVLLIDVQAVVGKTINQIADYAAMRTLARTRPAGASGAGADTILSLFDPGDAAGRPRGLTGFDAAYLKALYHGPATERAAAKLGQIARAVSPATETPPGR